MTLDWDQIKLIVNTVLLAVILILALIVARSGATHSFNIADDEIQTKMKWRILRCLVIMAVIALVAAFFNIIVNQQL